MDNTTAHAAGDYEREVENTIPFHRQLLEQAVDVAFAAVPSPKRWLDTGCGPGRLAELVRARCSAELLLADPSAAMLALARARHPDLPERSFLQVPSDRLPEVAPLDVITAVLCHHYVDEATRKKSLEVCFARLRAGGALVAFENVRAETPRGHELQRERWSRWLRAHGRDEAAVRTQLAREDAHFFPIPVRRHLEVLAGVGFGVVELVWRAYGQAGFLCLKPDA